MVTNETPFVNIPNYPEEDKVMAEINKLPHKIVLNVDKVAKEVGSARVANIVLLGATIPFLGIDYGKVQDSIREIFLRKGEAIVEMNLKALAAGKEIAEKLNEKVAEGMINISMNTAPYFEDGKAEGNVMIVNESINNYPQQVEFIRNDTGEQIYQSKAIPVGSKIERAALDAELPAGTYECTAMFHNLDPVSGETIGTAGAIINITIKN